MSLADRDMHLQTVCGLVLRLQSAAETILWIYMYTKKGVDQK